MQKTVVYRKSDNKITMIAEGEIGVNSMTLDKVVVDLTEQQWAEKMADRTSLYFENNEIKTILPPEMKAAIDRQLAKQNITERLNDEKATLADVKTAIIDLINLEN